MNINTSNVIFETYGPFFNRLLNSIDKIEEKKLVIYPMGFWGHIIRKFLSEKYHIEPVFCIDKKEADCMRIEDVSTEDLMDKTIIISAKDPILRGDIVSIIENRFGNVSKVLLFSDLSVEEINEVIGFQQKKCLLEKLDITGIEENGYIYHPQNCNALFWLPYVYSDYIQKWILLHDDYFERLQLEEVFKNEKIRTRILEKHAITLDIGANIGNHTLFFINEIGASKVVAFEAMPETFRILKKNISLNHLEENVQLVNCAVSNHQDSIPFPIDNYNYSNIGATQMKDQQADRLSEFIDSIPTVSIDSYNWDNVAFMKIDVEGMEIEVLNGALDTIGRCHPVIMAEVRKENFEYVKTMLLKEGYSYSKIRQDCPEDYIFY